MGELSQSSHRNKFMLTYHSHTLPRGAAWLWKPIVGLQCEQSPLATSPSNGKELPNCPLDWIVDTSWHARLKKKPCIFYRDSGLAPHQTCILGKGRIDILVIHPAVPAWHEFKQAVRDLSNPFPPSKDSIRSLLEIVIFWPTGIARNVMHPCLHALKYGKVIPDMWQVLNGLIRPVVNPSISMFIFPM